MGTRVCVRAFALSVCVFVLHENMNECLAFSVRHLGTMLPLEIMNTSHKQNLIPLIIRQHNNNNNLDLSNKRTTERISRDIRCQTAGWLKH